MTYDYPIWYIFLSFLISGLLSFFMYKKNIKTSWKFIFMAFLRFLSLLIVFIAIGTLMLPTQVKTTVKPKLVLAFDQSSSMLLNTSFEELESVFKDVNNSDLSTKYQIKNIGFGESVSEIDTLKFNNSRTNFNELEKSLDFLLTQGDRVILVSDGNINKGSSSVFTKNSSYSLDVIGVGDTISIPRISILAINYNKEVVVGNSFPLEIFIESSNFSGEVQLEVSEKEKNVLTERVLILPNINAKQKKRHSILLKSFSDGTHVFKVKLFSKQDKSLVDEKLITVNFVKNKGVILIKYSQLNPDVSLLKRKFSQKNYKVIVTKNAFSKKEISKFDFIVDFNDSYNKNLNLPVVLINSSFKELDNNQERVESTLDKKFLKSFFVDSKSKRIFLDINNLWKLNLKEAKRGDNNLNLFFHSLLKEIELLKYSDKYNVVFKDVYSSSENVVIKLVNEYSKMKPVNVNAKAKAEIEINGRKQIFDFIEEKGSYSLNIGNLESKTYTSKISVNGKKIETITFIVKDINMELLGNYKNINFLNSIVSSKETRLYNLENYSDLIDSLILKASRTSILKTQYKNIVEQWWILFLLPIILGVEWLLRKRNGLY